MELDKLKAPFPVDKISWRIGNKSKAGDSATALAYIDARDVMDRLDEVIGVENWYDEYHVLGNTTVCRLAIRIGEEWIIKEDGSGDTKVEAEKGALSKALVRAGVKFGIGRYLYDVETRYFKIDQWGQFLDSELPKMDALLGGTPPPKEPTKEEIYNGLKASLEATETTKTSWLVQNNEDIAHIEKLMPKHYDHLLGLINKKWGE